MANTSATYPGTAATAAGSGSNIVSWSNADNSKLSDNIYATAVGGYIEDPVTSQTNMLKVTNFDFSAIPAGATIDGIKVTIEKKSSHDTGSNYCRDYKLVLQKADGTAGATDKADAATNWGTSDTSIDYGGAADKWGLTPTLADVQDVDWGVRFEGTTVNASLAVTSSVDSISMTVYYTASASTPSTAKDSQAYLNTKAVTTGLSKQLAMNVLAGTTGKTLQEAANTYAGTSGLSVQNALNSKVSTSGLSTQQATSLL